MINQMNEFERVYLQANYISRIKIEKNNVTRKIICIQEIFISNHHSYHKCKDGYDIDWDHQPP